MSAGLQATEGMTGAGSRYGGGSWFPRKEGGWLPPEQMMEEWRDPGGSDLL